MPTAIITGASRGLGLALARALAQPQYRLILDARGGEDLARVAQELSPHTQVEAIVGDVTDEWHRAVLVDAAGKCIDLLVNNASALGPSPQPELDRYPPAELERVYRTTCSRPWPDSAGAAADPAAGGIINVSSDAALEAYAGWGGYGSSKAALEQLTAILAAEQPELRVYAVDPGDMRTQMHQEAFPDEDISDRPPPEDSVPGLLELIEGELPSGRYRAHELIDAEGLAMSALAFDLPQALEATAPPEARGVDRDGVRLLVAEPDRSPTHTRFHRLPELLCPGDLVVINVSATLAAAVSGERSDGRPVLVHFATRAPELDESWRVVELRSADGARPERGRAGDRIALSAAPPSSSWSRRMPPAPA